MSSKETDLALKEMILGVLKSKDFNNNYTIHSSDFRSTLTDLGFPMGSSIVEHILVFCRIDGNGFLNFLELEKELKRERNQLNYTNSLKKHQPIATSSSITAKPYRNDTFHQQKIDKEKYFKSFLNNNELIKDIYYDLSHKLISPDESINILQSKNITITKEFNKILKKMEYGEVTYQEFINSLTNYSINQYSLDDLGIKAGEKIHRNHPNDIPGMIHKRTTYGAQSAFSITNQDDEKLKPKPFRKPIKTGPVTDEVIFKAQKIREALFHDTAPVDTMSHNQRSMILGLQNSTDGFIKDTTNSELIEKFSSLNLYSKKSPLNSNLNFNYNCEQKLQREQVLAALRKLDANIITLDDFHELIYSIGLDLPENIMNELKRSVASGRLDVIKLVNFFDVNIFKSDIIEAKGDSYNYINNMQGGKGENSEEDLHNKNKSIIKNLLNRLKSDFLLIDNNNIFDLFISLRNCDENDDHLLSFSEFHNVFIELNLCPKFFSIEEVRLLFHYFDSDGNGQVCFNEFFNGINSNKISSTRIQMIKKIYNKFDFYANNEVNIELLSNNFNIEFYYNYFYQNNSNIDKNLILNKIKNNFLKFFTIKRNFDLTVNFDDFKNYFLCFSFLIDQDFEFENFINNFFFFNDDKELSEPAPSILKLRQGAISHTLLKNESLDINNVEYNSATPFSIQNHGNIINWNHNLSLLEKLDMKIESKKGKKIVESKLNQHFNNSSPNLIQHVNKHSKPLTFDEVNEELRQAGVSRIKRRSKNESANSLLQWDTNKRALEKERERSKIPIQIVEHDQLTNNCNKYEAYIKAAGGYKKEFKSFQSKKSIHLNSNIPYGTENDRNINKENKDDKPPVLNPSIAAATEKFMEQELPYHDPQKAKAINSRRDTVCINKGISLNEVLMKKSAELSKSSSFPLNAQTQFMPPSPPISNSISTSPTPLSQSRGKTLADYIK